MIAGIMEEVIGRSWTGVKNSRVRILRLMYLTSKVGEGGEVDERCVFYSCTNIKSIYYFDKDL